ncbi:DUF1776-domain-containing protein [Ascoidea rubescens DSM 1968]|uniref:DUF1776-domain-containing protein n=1 Tax=Ascoidea rubescens DSM 1968 TaxID=1344418 RepID=A0A1D2VD36_9ASCO|nr:DUF1776-domain-containing protein [Ascoidea rubescens DSM 1968]ODV59614.1 DUF1776-domain-containing protein [Ascoidea rubescens DSM 1968]
MVDPFEMTLDALYNFKQNASYHIQDSIDNIKTNPLFIETVDNITTLNHKIIDNKNKILSSIGIQSYQNAGLTENSDFYLTVDNTQSSNNQYFFKNISQLKSFIQNNKFLSLIFFGTAAFSLTLFYNRFLYPKILSDLPSVSSNSIITRKANKLDNGIRTDVIIIIGSPVESLIRMIARDLEKRGFVIYITAINDNELNYIKNENSTDIRPLKIGNLSSLEDLKLSLSKFNSFINSFQSQSHSINKNNNSNNNNNTNNNSNSFFLYKIMGVLVIPDLYYSIGPIENSSLKNWNNQINTKLLMPLTLLSNGFLNILRNNYNIINDSIKKANNSSSLFLSPSYYSKSKVILLTPSIISSINLPFHSLESICLNSLKILILSLSRELSNSYKNNIQFINLNLGSFDISSNSNSSININSKFINNRVNAELLSWNSNNINNNNIDSDEIDNFKKRYITNFKKISKKIVPINFFIKKNTSLRFLHYKLFDLLYNDIDGSITDHIINSIKTNSKDKTIYKKKMKLNYKSDVQTYYSGKGARIYVYLGNIFPNSLISWFLGFYSIKNYIYSLIF